MKVSTYNKLNAEYDFRSDEFATPPGHQRRHRQKTLVIKSADYSVKILQNTDPDLENEVSIMSKLNALSQENTTQVFSFGIGYILCPDIPPDIVQLEPISVHQPGIGYVTQSVGHYVYLFSEKIQRDFEALPDQPKINEDFFFEILIGLYYARRQWKFVHWDIHEKNLMFNKSSKPSSRTYRIGDNFYVTIANTSIEPKLIDYGKSAIDTDYMDERWQEPRFKKQWNKSDIYHLALIFSHRENLSDRFRQFLKEEVLIKYADAMYARKLEHDSAANYQNIEYLLATYFGMNQVAKCIMCPSKALFIEAKELRHFCGEVCSSKYHEL